MWKEEINDLYVGFIVFLCWIISVWAPFSGLSSKPDILQCSVLYKISIVSVVCMICTIPGTSFLYYVLISNNHINKNTCMETYVSSEMWRTICPKSRVKLYQMWTMQSFIMRALLAISSKPSQFYCAKRKENNNLETNTNNIIIERLNRHGQGRHRASRRGVAPRGRQRVRECRRR